MTADFARYAEDLALWEERPLEKGPTGGETIHDLSTRVAAAIEDIVALWPDGVVVIISHKVALNALRAAVTGEPLEDALRESPTNATAFRCEWLPPRHGVVEQRVSA